MTEAMYDLLYIMETVTSIVFYLGALYLLNKYITDSKPKQYRQPVRELTLVQRMLKKINKNK
tara:strand:- start:2691 stop:2876 length:186 start_codon:yes stop_codon:yes gene_type:complete